MISASNLVTVNSQYQKPVAFTPHIKQNFVSSVPIADNFIPSLLGYFEGASISDQTQLLDVRRPGCYAHGCWAPGIEWNV
jgi:hypothetical protein